jgi:uncharacterized delta-60 repeat protein
MARTSRLVSTALALTGALLASGLHPAAATGESAGDEPVSTRLDISLPRWDQRLTDVVAAPDGTTYILSDTYLTRATSAGQVDSGFGVNGYLTLPVLTDAQAMAWHDGDLVIAGTAFTGTGGQPTDGDDESAVIRIDVSGSGSLDPTFGANGVRMIGLPDADVDVTDVGVESDGDIVVLGSRLTFVDGWDRRVTLVRLDEDGDFDPTFDSDGIAVTDVANRTEELIVDDHGYVASVWRGGVTRFTTSGIVDTSFGVNGTYLSDIQMTSIAAMTGGEIAVSTVTYSRFGIGDITVGVTLLDRTGAPVPRFGDNGTRQFDLGGSFFAGRVVARADGRLLLTTSLYEHTTSTDVVHTVGLLADGTVDTSVGRNGWASAFKWNNGHEHSEINGAVVNEGRGILRIVGGYRDDQEWEPRVLDIALRHPGAPERRLGRVIEAALRDSGKTVVLRQWINVDDVAPVPDVAFRSFAVQKVRTSGQLDRTFADDGTYWFNSPRGMSFPDAIAVQATSVIVGYRDYGAGSPTTHLLRLDADGAVDRTFGRNGQIAMPTTTALQLVDVLVDSGGRIVTLSIEADTDGNPRIVLHRFTRNGSVDTGFGTGGFRDIPSSLGVHPKAELVQHGRGYIFATYTAGTRPVPRIVRVTTAGRLDTAFVTDLPPSGRKPNERATVGHFVAEASNDRDGGRIALIVGTGRPSLWVLRPDGSPVTTFGEGGRIRVQPQTREPDGLIEFRARGRIAVYEARSSGRQVVVNAVTYLRSGARDPDRPPFSKQAAASAEAIDLLRSSPSEPITAVLVCFAEPCRPTVRIATD